MEVEVEVKLKSELNLGLDLPTSNGGQLAIWAADYPGPFLIIYSSTIMLGTIKFWFPDSDLY